MTELNQESWHAVIGRLPGSRNANHEAAYVVVAGDEGRIIADCVSEVWRPDYIRIQRGSDSFSNQNRARLMAASPIGNTLAHMVLETASFGTPQVLIDLANEFIAKAEGSAEQEKTE